VSEYQKLFQIVEIYSPLIPLLVFFLKKPGKAVWIKLLVTYWLVYIFFVYSATHFFSKNNNIVYTVLSGVTFCFFALILEQFLTAQKFRFFSRTVIVIAVLFFIANAIWWEGILIFNSYSSAISHLILVGYCAYYYKLQLEMLQTIFVEKLTSFWIVSGIFIYSAGNIFLFSMHSVLARDYPQITYDMWDINILLTLIMNILFAKGIQCNWQK